MFISITPAETANIVENVNNRTPRAYQFIDAANIIENVNRGTQILPTSERQVRPLTKLNPEQQREVWAEIIETADEQDKRVAPMQAGKLLGTNVPKLFMTVAPMKAGPVCSMEFVRSLTFFDALANN